MNTTTVAIDIIGIILIYLHGTEKAYYLRMRMYLVLMNQQPIPKRAANCNKSS